MTPIEMPNGLRILMDRMGDEDSSALDRLFAGSALRQGLDELLTELAQAAREEEGFSWADVGNVLDITKQAAQQRFGKGGVVRVAADGTVTVTQRRKQYEAQLRKALEQLDAHSDEPIEVEVEVEVEVPVPAKGKAVKRKAKSKSRSG